MHTLGPWQYDISPDRRRQAFIIDDEGFTVAEIAGYTDMTATVELMNAAPKLLAALKACLYRLQDHDDQSVPECEAALAAIAQATYSLRGADLDVLLWLDRQCD